MQESLCFGHRRLARLHRGRDSLHRQECAKPRIGKGSGLGLGKDDAGASCGAVSRGLGGLCVRVQKFARGCCARGLRPFPKATLSRLGCYHLLQTRLGIRLCAVRIKVPGKRCNYHSNSQPSHEGKCRVPSLKGALSTQYRVLAVLT
jgi:hypothetical protein